MLTRAVGEEEETEVKHRRSGDRTTEGSRKKLINEKEMTRAAFTTFIII